MKKSKKISEILAICLVGYNILSSLVWLFILLSSNLLEFGTFTNFVISILALIFIANDLAKKNNKVSLTSMIFTLITFGLVLYENNLISSLGTLPGFAYPIMLVGLGYSIILMNINIFFTKNENDEKVEKNAELLNQEENVMEEKKVSEETEISVKN